jgi:hypothetical protein
MVSHAADWEAVQGCTLYPASHEADCSRAVLSAGAAGGSSAWPRVLSTAHHALD